MHDEEEFNPDPFDAKLKWVDGACYRIYARKTGPRNDVSTQRKLKPYCEYDEDELSGAEDCAGNVDKVKEYNVTQTDNGRYKTTIAIPQKFYAYIIGTKGSRKKQLEHETKTEITIPRSKTERNIIIVGPTVTNVVSARRRLQLTAMELRDRHMITHFISFPLISDQIKKNFEEFKKQVLQDETIRGVDESVFQRTDKLHLTIGTLVLLDQEEVDVAATVLSNMKEKVIDPYITSTGPIKLRMRGLQYMNDDPANVDVLYAKVEVIGQDSNLQIQKLSDKIVDYFHSEVGIMKKEYDMVKLHATVMNTRYRKERSPVRGDGKHPKRIAFDARPILEKYGQFDFGIQDFNSIELSDRATVDKNGYYGCKGSISL